MIVPICALNSSLMQLTILLIQHRYHLSSNQSASLKIQKWSSSTSTLKDNFQAVGKNSRYGLSYILASFNMKDTNNQIKTVNSKQKYWPNIQFRKTLVFGRRLQPCWQRLNIWNRICEQFLCQGKPPMYIKSIISKLLYGAIRFGRLWLFEAAVTYLHLSLWSPEYVLYQSLVRQNTIRVCFFFSTENIIECLILTDS